MKIFPFSELNRVTDGFFSTASQSDGCVYERLEEGVTESIDLLEELVWYFVEVPILLEGPGSKTSGVSYTWKNAQDEDHSLYGG